MRLSSPTPLVSSSAILADPFYPFDTIAPAELREKLLLA